MEGKPIESNRPKDSESYEKMREWHDRQPMDPRYGWGRVAPRYRRAPKSGWLGAALIVCGLLPIGVVALADQLGDGALPPLGDFLATNLVVAIVGGFLIFAGVLVFVTGRRSPRNERDSS
jgi:hypothetical protein